jgi:hypothetical protein
MTPSGGLSTGARPRVKKEKSRISLALCINATRIDGMPLWIIGNAKTLRAL